MASKEAVNTGGDGVARAQQDRAVAGNPTASERVREARAHIPTGDYSHLIYGSEGSIIASKDMSDKEFLAPILAGDHAAAAPLTRRERNWLCDQGSPLIEAKYDWVQARTEELIQALSQGNLDGETTEIRAWCGTVLNNLGYA